MALVEYISVSGEGFPAGAANRYVDKIFEEAWASGRELELWKKLPRDECLRYAKQDEPVTLPVARRIAYRLEIPIAELLGAPRPTIQSFGFAAEKPLPKPMQSGRRSDIIDRAKLIGELESIAATQTDPGSLRALSRSLNVSVGAIRYHCPSLARILVLQHTKFKIREAQNRRVSARLVVAEAIASWSMTEAPPIAKKPLLASLMLKTGLPKNLLRKLIDEQWFRFPPGGE